MNGKDESPGNTASLTEKYRIYVAALGLPGLSIESAGPGHLTHTDGKIIFLRADATEAEQFIEIAVQCALLRAGSLAPHVALTLIGQPQRARRYLALECARILSAATGIFRYVVPHSILICPGLTASVEQSLQYSVDRARKLDASRLFGVIRPMQLLAQRDELARGKARAADLRKPPTGNTQDPQLDDNEQAADAPKLFQRFASPLRMAFNPFVNLFNQLMGARRAAAADAPGGEIPSGSARQTNRMSAQGRLARYSLEIQPDVGKPPQLVSGWIYPEWNCEAANYRTDWVRLHETPLAWVRDLAPEQVAASFDRGLKHRLAGLTFGLAQARAQRDGDDFDVDALLDRAVTLQCARRGGDRATEQANVYRALRRTARDLGILIAVDLSGSSAETNAGGHVIWREQALIAAALAEAASQCGDRVAVIGFHARTRALVRAISIKHFGQRWDQGMRAALMRLHPSGFSRLGTVLRHSANCLLKDAGMPRKLLVMISDGFPYDSDYQGRYAREDVRQALQELDKSRIQVLWIALGELDPAIRSALDQSCHGLLIADSAAALLPKLTRAMTEVLLRRNSHADINAIFAI